MGDSDTTWSPAGNISWDKIKLINSSWLILSDKYWIDEHMKEFGSLKKSANVLSLQEEEKDVVQR